MVVFPGNLSLFQQLIVVLCRGQESSSSSVVLKQTLLRSKSSHTCFQVSHRPCHRFHLFHYYIRLQQHLLELLLCHLVRFKFLQKTIAFYFTGSTSLFQELSRTKKSRSISKPRDNTLWTISFTRIDSSDEADFCVSVDCNCRLDLVPSPPFHSTPDSHVPHSSGYCPPLIL